jgi:hypothetical protein
MPLSHSIADAGRGRPARPTTGSGLFSASALIPLLVLVYTFTPTTLVAQARAAIGAPDSADHFWMGASVGGAGARLTCDLCDVAREVGPTAEVSFGAWARPDLRVGVDAGGWTHDDAGERETALRAGIVAFLRPNLQRGFYFVSGFGWMRYSAGDFRYNAPRLSLGAGWDHLVGDRYRIGNQVTLDATSFGSLKNEDTAVARNVGFSLVRVSIQVHRF